MASSASWGHVAFVGRALLLNGNQFSSKVRKDLWQQTEHLYNRPARPAHGTTSWLCCHLIKDNLDLFLDYSGFKCTCSAQVICDTRLQAIHSVKEVVSSDQMHLFVKGHHCITARALGRLKTKKGRLAFCTTVWMWMWWLKCSKENLLNVSHHALWKVVDSPWSLTGQNTSSWSVVHKETDINMDESPSEII